MPIRSEALPYLLPLVLVCAGAVAAGSVAVAAAAGVAALGLGAFFRDPERSTSAGPEAVLAPADGRVLAVERGERHLEIAIFLSLFNVHVTRSPLSGSLRRRERFAGGYAPAFRPKASQNARVCFTIDSDLGPVELSLIAGVAARRVVPWVNAGDLLGRGQRIALIKFGSRAELRLPVDCAAVVSVGDRVRAGETVIARGQGETAAPRP